MSEIKIKKSAKEFEEKARSVHGDKYDYSKVEYIGYAERVCIICPEHGKFFQAPSLHLIGCGCPKCNSSKLEESVRNFLKDKRILFEEQKKFKWLGKQRLDFYLPEYNIAIECQGGQHFKSIEFFGGDIAFKKIIERDKKKNKLCKKNNIRVLYYSREDYPGMITNLDELNSLITN